MDALITLSPAERTSLLLWKESPEGEIDGDSLMDSLEAAASVVGSLDLSGARGCDMVGVRAHLRDSSRGSVHSNSEEGSQHRSSDEREEDRLQIDDDDDDADADDDDDGVQHRILNASSSDEDDPCNGDQLGDEHEDDGDNDDDDDAELLMALAEAKHI
eukprot:3827071-Rhodomonas_salina.1